MGPGCLPNNYRLVRAAVADAKSRAKHSLSLLPPAMRQNRHIGNFEERDGDSTDLACMIGTRITNAKYMSYLPAGRPYILGRWRYPSTFKGGLSRTIGWRRGYMEP